jgi:glycosyltransferase involved in cell wall biosynthesis
LTERPLSVVIPAHNEAAHIRATLESLLTSSARSGFELEIVVVDDGSTDGTASVVREALAGRLVGLQILEQPNLGRFAARRRGLEHAAADDVLLLDARVRLDAGALPFIHERAERGERVWNGDVRVEGDNALGDFWRLLAELAWRDYFDEPRTTTFGIAEFDRYPKGTGCFFAPRALLVWAFEQFTTRYDDVRFANDDTPVLRALAGREPIGISPSFSCAYSPRTSLSRFVRHSVHRGVVFLDGHGTPDSRFFPVVVGFYPASVLLAIASTRRPLVVPVAAALCGAVAAAYGCAAGKSTRDIGTLARVTPLYAFAHGVGMWRGLGRILRQRIRS